MPFDIAAARKSGKSDAEIASYLGSKLGFDVDAATKAGKTPTQIAEYLSTNERPLNTTPDMSYYKSIPKRMAETVAPYIKPALEVSALTAGGILGAPLGPAGSIAGAGLLYGVAKAGERAMTPGNTSLPEAALTSVKDVATGMMMQSAGEVAGPIIGKGLSLAGKVVKPVIGRLTGAGTGAVEEAIKSGVETGLRSNPITSNTAFDRAMRGEITADEVVKNAKDALNIIKNNRAEAYQIQLREIAGVPKDMSYPSNGNESITNLKKIDMTPIASKLKQLLGKYNVKGNLDPVTNDITIDTSRVAMGKSGVNDIKDVIKTINHWGKQPGDDTAIGLDILKRQLDDFYSDSSQARGFVADLRNTVKNTIVKAVPQYGEMTKGYAEATTLIKDLESGLMLRKQGMTGRIVADQTLRRLSSAMRDNFPLRRELVDALGTGSGQDIAGQVAGHTMSEILPRGLAGSAPALGAEALAAWKLIDPKFWPLFAASSPRLMGETLRMIGKAAGETTGATGALGKATGITGVYGTKGDK